MTASPDRAGRTVTSENAADFGMFSEHRKTATTRISDFTMPPGTTYQTPEGLRAEDEETRIAFDVQGGVYPIRESVFLASYALAATGDSEGPLDVERAADDVRWAGGGGTSDYWRGFNDGIDKLAARLTSGDAPR